MSSYRKNTLVVDFSGLPKRPYLDQVEKFLKQFIKLDMADVKSIQLHNLQNCVYIEMNNAGVAPRLHKQHHLQHAFTHEGVSYYVPIYVDGPTTTVRILDLPPHVSNTAITKHMEQYGKVISIQNEVWKNFFPGVPNGVKIVRMRMEKQVPKTIVIENHSTLINFPPDRSAPSSVTDNKKPSQAPSHVANEQNNNNNENIQSAPHNAADPQSKRTDDSNTSESESDGEHETNNDNDQLELEHGKRRLSTETEEGSTENESKRTCSEGGPDSEWRVYNTRSRKNK